MGVPVIISMVPEEDCVSPAGRVPLIMLNTNGPWPLETVIVWAEYAVPSVPPGSAPLAGARVGAGGRLTVKLNGPDEADNGGFPKSVTFKIMFVVVPFGPVAAPVIVPLAFRVSPVGSAAEPAPSDQVSFPAPPAATRFSV